MPLFPCRHCEARNDYPGRCIVCGKSLGSYPKAFIAAAASAQGLAFLWVAGSMAFGIPAIFFAIFFGGLVSGAVTTFSGGRGFGYQAIATGFTILGIVLADTILVWNFWPQLTGSPNTARPGFSALMEWLFLYDNVTGIFSVLGVVGGMFIWHHGGD